MSNKQNLYIETDLLNKCNRDGNITKTVTQALKVAKDNMEDFILFTKLRLGGTPNDTLTLSPDDLLFHGRLKYNLYVSNSCVDLFVQKNTLAEMDNGILIIDLLRIDLNEKSGVHMNFSTRKNNFNTDESCIEITYERIECDG